MLADVQPSELVPISATTSANSPLVTSAVPTTSRWRCRSSRDSVTVHRQTTAAIAPIGTFTQKTADQDTRSTRNPPASGPTESPSAETPAQTPIAVGSCLRGNAATRIESDSGLSSAAPAP